MHWLGIWRSHTVSKVEPKGCHLETPEGPAFLSKSEYEEGPEVGGAVEALIYHDYDGFLTATRQRPHTEVGRFAALRIKAAGDKGAFADWGLEKDLFIPHAEQLEPVVKGGTYLTFTYVDSQSGRITASTRVDRFARDVVEPEDREVFPEAGTEVSLLISRKTDLGYKAVILLEKPYSGTLYHNEVFKKLTAGQPETGYIKQLREDGKIDLSLRKPGYEEVLDSKEQIYQKLAAAEGGYLPYHDKSDADEIRRVFAMSKRTFKASVGGLLKEGRIDLLPDGIRIHQD
ncbi:MAG: GntR family transcriptional regulator [Candidatus Cyclonatronum sp.]|uniref:CvfB family protein n=1 Tax=Cyclonatronum sp. TaxID=3024185 RepID=UPI0025C20A76|nr:S1-like domain-containing RNA-binding protein [Cyclonatronum sp.]MCH8486550.1 GntR family transcriptional regulator [Cyclonatronum sp.]